MGLFNIFKKNLPGTPTDRIKANLAYQNDLLSRVNAAREKYKIDKDLNSAIKEYEFAFVHSDPPCKSSQAIDLADLYIKAEEYDKAWGYLNQLMLRGEPHSPVIKFYFAKILKKQGKYDQAIEMYAIGYFYKSIPDQPFQADKFHKDISSSVKKLGWSQDKVDDITNIIMSQPHKNADAEGTLVRLLRQRMSEP